MVKWPNNEQAAGLRSIPFHELKVAAELNPSPARFPGARWWRRAKAAKGAMATSKGEIKHLGQPF